MNKVDVEKVFYWLAKQGFAEKQERKVILRKMELTEILQEFIWKENIKA